jgi:trans-2,3-dihydro-3-hydroxyanthranilate isomerase
MAAYDFVTLNVFAARRFGGNPLAVFPDAQGLDTETMQAVAHEINLSETVFVLPPADPGNHAALRIFTPRRELPFAGHPTVGAAFLLADRVPVDEHTGHPGRLLLELGAGVVPAAIIRAPDGTATGAEIEAPHALSVGDALPTDLVAACIGLPETAIATTSHHPLVAGVGLPFVIAEIADRAHLAAARPELAAFRDAAARFSGLADHLALHLYVIDPADPARVYARMFSPLAGIPEDAATGSANAALAALLVALAPGDDLSLAFEIEQGAEMGRPSRLIARATKTGEGPVIARVGGDCIAVSRGAMVL